MNCNRKRPVKQKELEQTSMFQTIWKRFKGVPHQHQEGEDTEIMKTPNDHTEPAERKNVTEPKQMKSQESSNDGDGDSDDSDDSSCSTSSSDDEDAFYDVFPSGVPTKRKASATGVPNFELQDLARTQFPDFELESIPDGELTDTSDDESVIREKQERYRTKEDQDVAVFLDIAKRMSLKSLLHLLQGHVRTQHLSAQYLQQYNAALSCADGKRKTAMKEKGAQNKTVAKKKQFRWAEVTHDKVRVVVHEIESVKEHKELWWRPEEMQSIRADLIETVKFFRRYRPNYVRSIETIARHTDQESVLEDHMKQLTNDSYARGLETHIVKMMSDHRKTTITAILEEQRDCKYSGDDYDTTIYCLREQSLAYSQMSAKFAHSMGRCDQIDALKASMSRWRSSQPATGPFFG